MTIIETAPQFSEAFVTELRDNGAENLGSAADCTFRLMDSETGDALRLATEDETRESFDTFTAEGHIWSDEYTRRVYVEVS